MSDLLFGPVIKLYLAQARDVWNDPAVWIAERDRQDRPELVTWPMPAEGTAYERELAGWFNGEVEAVLFFLAMAEHAALPDLPPDVTDPRFQLVLRVVARAWAAGRQAVEREFDGSERITGWGEWKGEWRARVVDFLQRSGLRKEVGEEEAYAAFGISRSAAYRAMKR